jgi:hypothetical protein
MLKSIELNINIKKDKKEIEIAEPEHNALKGSAIGRVDDFTEDFDGDDSSNVDKNPSKVLTKEELEVIKQRNDEQHERYKEMKDEVLPLNNQNGTWKRLGNTITNF